MNLHIEQLKTRLQKLKDFINSKKIFQEKELLDWIADSISFMVEIGVNNEILKGFIRFFEFEKSENNMIFKPNIGPFIYQSAKGTESGYCLGCNFLSSGEEKPIRDNYYMRIAFVAARSILNKEQEEERLVPKFLIDLLSQNTKYPHIISSLELLEKAYTEKNPDGLVKNTITLLDSILDLESVLKSKGKTSKKINILISNPVIRKKFGIEREFVFALDNSRLIRNLRSVHKSQPLNYNIPFIVAAGCVYLVIILLENTISQGELIV